MLHFFLVSSGEKTTFFGHFRSWFEIQSYVSSDQDQYINTLDPITWSASGPPYFPGDLDIFSRFSLKLHKWHCRWQTRWELPLTSWRWPVSWPAARDTWASAASEEVPGYLSTFLGAGSSICSMPDTDLAFYKYLDSAYEVKKCLILCQNGWIRHPIRIRNNFSWSGSD